MAMGEVVGRLVSSGWGEEEKMRDWAECKRGENWWSRLDLACR